MSTLTIVTDNKPRELHPLIDLPNKVRAEFAYLLGSEEQASDAEFEFRFIRYKGQWYDTADMMPLSGHELLSQEGVWTHYAHWTAWSGVVLRWVEDEWGDFVPVMGTYTS